MTMVAAIEAVSAADGAAGWCSMIASTTSSMAAFLPEATAREIYGDRTSITGGVFAPNGNGVATRRNGVAGFEVTGRWAWGSGTQHCRWVLGGASCDDGTFRLCWAPQTDVSVPRHLVHVGHAGLGLARLLVRRRVRAGRAHDPTRRHATGRRHSAGAVPELRPPRRWRVGGRPRHRPPRPRRVDRSRPGQDAAVLLAHAGEERLHADRGGPRRRAAPRGARLSPRAVGGHVADGAARRRGVDRRRASVSVRLPSTPRPPRRPSPTLRSRSPAAPRSTTRAGSDGHSRDAHVVTQHIQTAPKLNETIGKLLLGVDVDTDPVLIRPVLTAPDPRLRRDFCEPVRTNR